MALFGGQRDISLFRHLNRELMGNIITQQCAFYKYKVEETNVNIYGEASEEKYYMGPVLLNCIIERRDQEYPETDLGTDFSFGATFKFLRDDLLPAGSIGTPAANVFLEVGDIIWWDAIYWEIDAVVEHQYLFGKNPDTDKGFIDGGRTDSLGGEFGSSFSIIVNTHETRKSKLRLEKIRSGTNNRISNL